MNDRVRTARPRAEADAEETRWERTKANARTIGGAVLLALFIRIVLFEAFEIDGPSMEPTLLHGDRVVVAKYLYGLFLPFTDQAILTWGLPDVGDVVIVRSPLDNIDIVKRVIGVPGDRLEIREDVVYRNGEPIRVRGIGPCGPNEQLEVQPDCTRAEEHVGAHDWYVSYNGMEAPSSHHAVVVPPDHIFVMGDHRDRSNDSRNPRVGMIPASRIKGRALAIYWSNGREGIRWGRLFEGIR